LAGRYDFQQHDFKRPQGDDRRLAKGRLGAA